ncbi:gene 18.7 [Escherichia phage T7]|uniref:Gene 18.7 n=1 Tax=Escherichia phage T7 TaxID=10760 RepID=Q6WY13_BPT7|nr:gene 18.7 [Escherichia phage T7]AAP34168.1 gene 18.7 [Escherichia phage T7]
MSTLRELRLRRALKEQSVRYLLSIKKTLPRWKGALIGLFLICVATISGCASESKLPESPMVSVDSSLMVEPNLTTEMLNVFSQ